MLSYQVFMTILVCFIFIKQANSAPKDKNYVVSPKGWYIFYLWMYLLKFNLALSYEVVFLSNV